jgi:hypothetical protein
MPSALRQSILILEDFYLTYDSSSGLSSKIPLVSLQGYFGNSITSQPIFLLSPFVIVPELMYEEGHEPVWLNEKYPHLLPNSRQIKTDLWPDHYIRCAYYIPSAYRSVSSSIEHLLSPIARYNRIFLDQHTNACWTFKWMDHLILFLKIEGSLKEVRFMPAASPDDSTYLTLKAIEKLVPRYPELVVSTNEQNSHHLQILQKYLPMVVLHELKESDLIKNIVEAACVSSPED